MSSSRQMMMAWKVSGLSQRPGDHRFAAGLDALGDGDFALARQKLDRAHLAQIHAHGIVGAVGRLLLGGRRGNGRAGLLGKLVGVFLGVGRRRLGLGLLARSRRPRRR